MKNWGPEWGDIVSIGIPTKVDYHDSYRNKYYHVMGEYPADEGNLTKVPKEVPPEVYWAGAQHYLSQMGLSGRVVV
eukprot:5503632-Karenia_brevis.AAC.1